MKKRRAILGVLLPILALTLSACDFNPANLFNRGSSSQQSSSRRIRSGKSSSSSYNNGHVHRFSDQWSYNSQYHWHDSTCGHDVRSDSGIHNIQSEVIKAATCQETGQRIDYCTICGYEATVTVPTTNHTWSVYETKDATCEEYGYVKKFCSVCGLFTTEEIPAIGHNIQEIYIQEPTCTEQGIIEQHCTNCDYSYRYYTEPLGHDYQIISGSAATCSQGGTVTKQCMRCGLVIESAVAAGTHTWAGNQMWINNDEGIPYLTDNCIYCGARKIALPTASASINGSIKSSVATNYGYIKLGSNGNSYMLDFYYPEHAYVRIYQHAVFDNWRNENYRSATYHSVSSAVSYSAGYNFSLQVNGQLVDLEGAANITYADFFSNNVTEIPELIDNGFSPAADCLVGDAEIYPGLNNIIYTRLGSYALNVDYIVLVITSINHEHSYSGAWSYDETYHWNTCTNPNCPISGGIINKSEHNFYQYAVNRGSSCNELAEVIYRCAECGFMKSNYESMDDHVYDYEQISYVTNSNGYQLEIDHCTICNKTVEALQFSVGIVTEGSYQSSKLKAGTTMKWEFPVTQTGLVSLYLPVYASSSSHLSQMFDPSLYSVTFNGTAADILVPYATYSEIGVALMEPHYIKFATYEVTENDLMRSEVQVCFTSNVSSYRLSFDGQIRLEY